MPRNSTQYVITGAKNWRLGSRAFFKRPGGLTVVGSPDNRGTNLQNIEKGLRSVYIPDGFSDDLIIKCLHYLDTKDVSIFTDEERSKLKIFVQVDQAGADAKIVAYLLKKGNKLRQMFECGIKPHVYIGFMFPEHWRDQFPYVESYASLPITELKKQAGWKAIEKAIKDSDNAPAARRYYYNYKQTVHSGNYGIRANTFRFNVLEKSGGKIVLSLAEAEAYLSAYHKMLPELREWHHETISMIKKTGRMFTCQGFPWEVTDEVTDSVAKELYSIVPAATVACITHQAYADMQDYIEASKMDWDLLNNCHDSYLAQVPVGDEANAARIMLDFMTRQDLVSPTNGEHFRMGAEAQIGFNWSPSKGCPEGKDKFDPANINKYNLLGLR